MAGNMAMKFRSSLGHPSIRQQPELLRSRLVAEKQTGIATEQGGSFANASHTRQLTGSNLCQGVDYAD
jgi:hypothetical protein